MHRDKKGMLNLDTMTAEKTINHSPINEQTPSRQHRAAGEGEDNQSRESNETLADTNESPSRAKTRLVYLWSGVMVSLGLATCIVFIVGHLLGNSWLNVHMFKSTEAPALDHEERIHETGERHMAAPYPPQHGHSNKVTSAVVRMPLPTTETSTADRVVIQVGAFREKENAERLVRRLVDKGYNAYLDTGIVNNQGPFYWVRLRGYANESVAKTTVDRLKKEEGLNDSFALTVMSGDEKNLPPAQQ
jgi:hypothetical protein